MMISGSTRIRFIIKTLLSNQLELIYSTQTRTFNSKAPALSMHEEDLIETAKWSPELTKYLKLDRFSLRGNYSPPARPLIDPNDAINVMVGNSHKLKLSLSANIRQRKMNACYKMYDETLKGTYSPTTEVIELLLYAFCEIALDINAVVALLSYCKANQLKINTRFFPLLHKASSKVVFGRNLVLLFEEYFEPTANSRSWQFYLREKAFVHGVYAALDSLQRAEANGILINTYHYNALLHACSLFKSLENTLKVYYHAEIKKIELEPYTYRTIAHICKKSGADEGGKIEKKFRDLAIIADKKEEAKKSCQKEKQIYSTSQKT